MRLIVLALALVSAQDPAREPNRSWVWAAGPLEVRAVFERPIDPAEAERLVGREIAFGRPGPRSDAIDGPPLGSLRIAAARLENGGRTLVLATDPHPRDALYVLPDPALGTPWFYLPRGADAAWTADEAEAPDWSGWWPKLDVGGARPPTLDLSTPIGRLIPLLAKPGHLHLSAFASLAGGPTTVAVESDAPFEASVEYAPLEVVERGGVYRAEAVVEPTSEPVEVSFTVETGRGGNAPALRVTSRGPADRAPLPLGQRLNSLRPPWLPPSLPTAADVPAPPFDLAGGDPKRGEAIFAGEEARCSACHQVDGQGGTIGPDLSNLVGEDRARVYRDIADPSALIHPEYQPYSVALHDGRVIAGIVRAEGADKVRISDISAQATVVERSEVAELRPSATSIMPVGLAGALGEDRIRDLIAYLTARTRTP